MNTRRGGAPEVPDGSGAHGGAAEFWDDWLHDRGTVAVAVLVGVLGTVVMLAVVRSAGSVDDWFGLFLFGAHFILAGAMLTVGVLMPLMYGWDAHRVLVRCSSGGLEVGDATHPWSAVRTVVLGHETVEAGLESNPEGRATFRAYHVVIGTDAGTVRVPGRVWRTRGHELAAVVGEYAPWARVEVRGGSAFRPQEPPRPVPPSRARVRTESVALAAGSLLLGAALCAAVLRWAPAVVTLG
ncbi:MULTISPECIES: hypothetical protein [unclassified Streptomyces]|uniref:hypothetical protein n=1 Tax=unclassified Streptomyces TaxID=2593676 RepID=UPI0015A5F3ED|nr:MULTISPECIES: hypothetical protein [unclassified Streptomyces]